MRHLQSIKDRIQHLVSNDLLLEKEGERFLDLEKQMNKGPDGGNQQDLLKQFHVSDDNYVRLLEKVLEALVRIGETGATEKLQYFLKERGIMLPAVYLTPWELTLKDLDDQFDEEENQASIE